VAEQFRVIVAVRADALGRIFAMNSKTAIGGESMDALEKRLHSKATQTQFETQILDKIINELLGR
jgi:hypothetical protein